ncbi:hypothetical protein DEJ32_04880 [Curtobacterium sp. MCPF17_046]|nr:hypothetical protein DEJ32_04880 [Curtobacterium sp. MCPF17_046]
MRQVRPRRDDDEVQRVDAERHRPDGGQRERDPREDRTESVEHEAAQGDHGDGDRGRADDVDDRRRVVAWGQEHLRDRLPGVRAGRHEGHPRERTGGVRGHGRGHRTDDVRGSGDPGGRQEEHDLSHRVGPVRS